MRKSRSSIEQIVAVLKQAELGMPVADVIRRTTTALVGPDILEPAVAKMGAEDFSFMLRVRPGAYFRIGQGGAETGCLLHGSRYDFNDAILPLGAALFARLAEQSMPVGSTG